MSRFRTASRRLAEFIQHWQRSLTSWLRGIWPDPAHEDANNILVDGTETESTIIKRSSHGPRHSLDEQKRYAKVGNLLGRCSAEHLPFRTRGAQPWTVTPAQGDHAKNSVKRSRPRVAAALGELQLWQMHWIGWTARNTTNHTRWELLHRRSRDMPSGLKRERSSWNCVSCGATRHEKQASTVCDKQITCIMFFIL